MGGGASVIRAVRALRPLRALKRMPGMPKLVGSLLSSIPKLADVLADMQVAPTRRDQRRLGRGCHGGMADAAWRLAGMHEERLRQSLHG